MQLFLSFYQIKNFFVLFCCVRTVFLFSILQNLICLFVFLLIHYIKFLKIFINLKTATKKEINKENL